MVRNLKKAHKHECSSIATSLQEISPLLSDLKLYTCTCWEVPPSYALKTFTCWIFRIFTLHSLSRYFTLVFHLLFLSYLFFVIYFRRLSLLSTFDFTFWTFWSLVMVILSEEDHSPRNAVTVLPFPARKCVRTLGTVRKDPFHTSMRTFFNAFSCEDEIHLRFGDTWQLTEKNQMNKL